MGLWGSVVEGGGRDTDFILALGSPVHHTFSMPSDLVARGLPSHCAWPLGIGTVRVSAGDFAGGDREDLEVISHAEVAQVIAQTEQVAVIEKAVRDAIGAAVEPVFEAYLKYGKF